MHALRTNQVDAIVGDRHVMLVRLRQAEEDLAGSRDQLRALATRLLSVRDDERLSIARELHDEFGQALTSIQLGLSWLGRNLPPNRASLHQRIAALSDTTTTMIRSVRDISAELRPGTLDELGLVKTLRSVARGFEPATGVACAFTTNAARTRFDRAAAVAVYRIVQAALTNVARHAGASRVAVALLKDRRELTLTVADSGKGISRKLADSPLSVGISGMRERTLALGGTFTLAGVRGRGTTLTARIPLPRVLTAART